MINQLSGQGESDCLIQFFYFLLFYIVFVFSCFFNFDILLFFVFFDAKIPGGSGRFREAPGGSTFFVAGVF